MGCARMKDLVCDSASAFSSRRIWELATAFPTVSPWSSKCFTLHDVIALLGGMFSFAASNLRGPT